MPGGAFDFNYNKQESKSEFGASPRARGIAENRVLNDLGPLASQYSTNLITSPMQRPQLDKYSLFPGQMAGLNQLYRNFATQSSATRAARGQLSPENQSAVTSSAFQRISPQILNLQSANQQFALGFNEQTLLQRLAAARGLTSIYSPVLQGGTASSSGFGFGFGIEGGY